VTRDASPYYHPAYTSRHMEPAPESGHDRAVFDLVSAADSGEFDHRLDLLLRQVDPVVEAAVRRALGTHGRGAACPREEVEDLKHDVSVLLVRRLRALRADPDAAAIQSFPAYASTVAANACYAHFRRMYPQWTRLKNQVRYLATHDPTLTLTRGDGERTCCALAEWKGTRPRVAVVDASAISDAATLPLAALVQALLRRANGSVDIDTIVGAIAAARGIAEVVSPAAPAAVDVDAEQVADSRSAGQADEQASFLKRLWTEVRALPQRQRAALLLNLRDDRGRGVLALFSLTGTASMRQVADALGMAADELAQLWRDLPMDDRRIAERLGITRQQVINLRKAARARLARRTAADRAGV